MALLKMEFKNNDFQAVNEMRKLFPELRASTMGYVGAKSRSLLKKQFLSGQEIDLKAYPRDSKGRRTTNYSIGKKAKYVRISSYPLNLFEKGRMLRSGRKEPGKKIITGKLKKAVMSQLQGWVNEFDQNVWEKELNKI